MTPSPVSYGWSGTFADFLRLPSEQWLACLREQHLRLYNGPPSNSQIEAWVDEHETLVTAAERFRDTRPDALRWHLLFEYELPRERGRRPDLVILTGRGLIIVEFKQTDEPLRADIDQVEAYCRDLCHYHGPSHGQTAATVLALTGSDDDPLRRVNAS